ncbi:MAG: glycerol-3-phosphate 1-O-acyltransferase PlsY [Gammaproteobacteria bacterium]|nr:glycerol-3-phosphate 1-O-acyltransferase PlsY [Gammaproteobacteria bacterium]
MRGIIFMIIAYLLGSLSMAIILSKYLKFPDPRNEGSGNAGATNVLRTVGKDKAIMVLIGDILKGLIAVLLARLFGVQGFMLGLVAFAAVIGHMYPVFFGFKGGKGVATAMGTIIVLSLWVGIVAAIVWVAIAFILRYASLASLIAAAAAPILMLIFGHMVYFIPVLLIAGAIFWKHKDNIRRLKTGTENKINF